MDHLLVIDLLLESPKSPTLRGFSEDLANQVESWIEGSSEKSVLFREWIRGEEGKSKSDEIFGSLGIQLDSGKCRTRA